jgi:hypothetical protein
VTARRIVASTQEESIRLFFDSLKNNEAIAQLQLSKSAFPAHTFANGVQSVQIATIKLSGQKGAQKEYAVRFKAVLAKKSNLDLRNGVNQFFIISEKINGRYCLTSIGTGPSFY